MGIYPHPFLRKIEPSTAQYFAAATPIVAQATTATPALAADLTTEKN